MEILIIDEDINQRNELKFKIEMLDLKIVLDVAYNGNQAIEKLRSWTPDLIFSALEMQRMDGTQVVQEIIHNLKIEVPIVILPSIHSYDVSMQGVLLQGASELLPINYTLDDLGVTINKYMS